MTRVTFVSSGLDTGGAEFALLRLLPAMRAYEVESSVVSLRSIGAIGPQLQSLSVPTLCLGMPAPSAILVGLPRLVRHLRKWGSMVVHGWMYHGNMAATAAATVAQLPVVWGIRQSLGLANRDRWLTRRIIEAGALLSGRPSRIVYNSAAARGQHEQRGYYSSYGVVIPNGFDTEQLRPNAAQAKAIRGELGITEGAPVIGHVARFHPSKDHQAFLKVAATLRDKFPNAVFVMVGEGVDASNPQLAALITQLGLSNRLRLLGRRGDVARLMSAFDVFCLTSTGMEGFPNVIGEAMSCGVPCVGTAVGDVAELIDETGEVVPPGDPAAIAAAVSRLLELKPVVRGALGAQARKRIIDRFSIDEVARRYADLLHAVADRQR